MELRIEKVDYDDEEIRSATRYKRGQDFRIAFNFTGGMESGALTRRKLVEFRNELNKILQTKKKPRYTAHNDSSIAAVVHVSADD